MDLTRSRNPETLVRYFHELIILSVQLSRKPHVLYSQRLVLFRTDMRFHLTSARHPECTT